MEPRRIRVGLRHFKGRPIQLQWISPTTGRRVTRSSGTSDAQEARQRANDLEYELARGLHAEPSRLGWAAFREAFEAEHVAGCRPNTRRLYAQALDDLERECNPTTLRAVTARTVSALVAALRARLQPSTIAMRLAYLRCALRWARRQKLIPEVPEFPAVRVPKRRPQPVPSEAWERLLARCDDPQLAALLACCWLAGLRLGEAFALRWEESDSAPWVDLAGRRIRFPAAAVKGDADSWVPLDPKLQNVIVKLALQNGTGSTGNVFDFGGVQAHAVGERVRRLARGAGVRLSVRSLRRGFACRYASKVPAQVLQRLLRHASVTTTIGFYSNVDEAAMEAVLGNAADNAGAGGRAESPGKQGGP